MSKTRVLVLSDYGGGETAATGGAGHAVMESYRALHGAGIDVEMIVGFGHPALPDMEQARSLDGRDLRAGGAADTLRVIYHAAARSALERVLDTADPATTLIILHQWTRFLSPAVAFTLQRYRTMIYMHDYFWACPNGAYFNFIRQAPCSERPLSLGCIGSACDRGGRVTKLGRLARHTVLNHASTGHEKNRLFLSLSPEAATTALRLLPGEKHAIIHNPTVIEARRPKPATEAKFDVGYFGRLEPEKGVAHLCETAAELGATSLFVGQGALEQQVRDTPDATHEPWQAHAGIVAAMRRCRVIALPSLWPETWGLIVPEAMSAGVPVLVSQRAGSSELISRFGGGMTFDPDVPGDLAQKLATLVATPSTVDADNWPEFRSFLSPDTHAAQISQLALSTWGLKLATHAMPTILPPLAEATAPVALPQLAM